MGRDRRYPHWALELTEQPYGPYGSQERESAPGAPVLLNGMRVVFSERVPLYPLDLDVRQEAVDDVVPAPDGLRS